MLTLPIKKKWFDMILSGEKKEEYRDIKPYYTSRFLHSDRRCITVPMPWLRRRMNIKFRNGYSGQSPYFVAECELTIGKGREEWGAELNKEYYVLKILEIQRSGMLDSEVEV